MAHPDLPVEQAYVDEAYASLDRMREALLRAAAAGATDVAQQAIEDWATGRLRTYEDAERGLCFGRIDSSSTGRRLPRGPSTPRPRPRRTASHSAAASARRGAR